MNNLVKDLFMLPVAGVILSGCIAAPQYPSTYDLNEKSFSRTVAFLAQKLYRETGVPAKISVVQSDMTFDPPFLAGCTPSSDCDYVYSNDNPDIIVKIETVGSKGAWSESQQTSGYYPIHTRLGFDVSTSPYSQDGWRQIELNDSWQASFPYYFPEDLSETDPESTRFAVTGHMRGFQFIHQNLFELTAANINALNPEYTFMLGDFTRSSRGYEYDYLNTHFIQNLATTAGGNTVYLPGNHEVRNQRLTTEDPYVDEFRFFEKEQEHAWNRPSFIGTSSVNLIPINSASTSAADIQQQLQDVAIHADYDAALPTVLLTHHKVWNEWHWSNDDIMPYFTADEVMPLMSSGQTSIVDVDTIIDGDGQDFIGRGVLYGWDSEEYLSVGMGMKGESAPIYFSIITMGQNDKILRQHPFYLDLPADHEFYTVVDYQCDENGCSTPPVEE